MAAPGLWSGTRSASGGHDNVTVAVAAIDPPGRTGRTGREGIMTTFSAETYQNEFLPAGGTGSTPS